MTKPTGYCFVFNGVNDSEAWEPFYWDPARGRNTYYHVAVFRIII